ncbi:MAG TPA: glycosyltransferase family 39 protein [Alphaproteobacteria bacterium]|jgi:4-amino-4-deoxy-L-arabinose transferase-like glycosyltransferase|nr:glycosyltransferase family 39 protein [Alphaproteobacteria bacterium]
MSLTEDESEEAEVAAPASPSWADRALSWLAGRPWATLSLLCLLLWTPGVLSLPALDRDESRFAQASRQMLESGNFVDIRFGHVPRYKKPVGIYWLQAATTAIAGLGDRSHIWTYRLPSLLGGLLAVLLTFWCARAFASPEVAWLSGALMGTSLLLTAESTIATTDAVQLACVMGVMGVLFRLYLQAREPDRPPLSNRLLLAGWAALAAGILIKGPVVPAVAIVTIIALVIWERDWAWLAASRWQQGLPLAVLIVVPWLIAIAVASHGQFFQQSVGHDFAAKLEGGQESHGAWPGYYLLLLTISFWPAILFLAPGIAKAAFDRDQPAVRFLICWAGVSWLMFEIVPTKLPHYILPAYPALAILAASWALAPRDPAAPRWMPWLTWLAAFQFALGLAALVAAPIIAPQLYGDGSNWWLIGFASVGGVVGLAALVIYLRRAVVAAFGIACISVLILYPVISAGVGPRLDRLWVSAREATLLKKDSRPGDPPPVLAGFTEPSAVFLNGTNTGLSDGAGAAEITVNEGGLAAVEDHEREAFLAHLAEREADAEPVDELTGFNYSRGRKVHITIYRVDAMHDIAAPPPE